MKNRGMTVLEVLIIICIIGILAIVAIPKFRYLADKGNAIKQGVTYESYVTNKYNKKRATNYIDSYKSKKTKVKILPEIVAEETAEEK